MTSSSSSAAAKTATTTRSVYSSVTLLVKLLLVLASLALVHIDIAQAATTSAVRFACSIRSFFGWFTIIVRFFLLGLFTAVYVPYFMFFGIEPETSDLHNRISSSPPASISLYCY